MMRITNTGRCYDETDTLIGYTDRPNWKKRLCNNLQGWANAAGSILRSGQKNGQR